MTGNRKYTFSGVFAAIPFPGRFLLCCILLLSACSGEEPVQPSSRNNDKQLYQELLKVNQYLVKRNREMVENFVRRTGWDMKNTGTGLWYMIVDEGEGKEAAEGDRAVVSYKIRLLDGTLITTDPEWLRRSFVIGKGGVVAGMEEGVRYMKEGGYARFILPPHLAYGNFGELDKIPPGSILMYDVKLLDLK